MVLMNKITSEEKISAFSVTQKYFVMQTAGRGICGASQRSAARETARRASKLDEEGLEAVVCRHGVLLKALNMYRGEIFAYPLFLQKELQAATNRQFCCTDIACKYWPYLEKLAVSMLELRPLLQMRPSNSFCHACQGPFYQVWGTTYSLIPFELYLYDLYNIYDYNVSFILIR